MAPATPQPLDEVGKRLKHGACRSARLTLPKSQKPPARAEALRLRDAGFEAVQQLYSSRAVHVEELKSVAMALRRLPVVDPRFPMV